MSAVITAAAGDLHYELTESARSGGAHPWLDVGHDDAVDGGRFKDGSAIVASTVEVTINVSGSTAAITKDWTGPPDHPVLRAALELGDDGVGIVSEAVAFAFLSPWQYEDLAIDVTVDADAATVRTTQNVTLAGHSWSGRVFSSPTAGVTLERVRVLFADDVVFTLPSSDTDDVVVPPNRISATEAVWEAAPRAAPLSARFELDVPRAGVVTDGPASRGETMVEWARAEEPEWLRRMLIPLFDIAPFGLALWWVGTLVSVRRIVEGILWLAALPAGVLMAWGLLEQLNGPIAAYVGSREPAPPWNVEAVLARQAALGWFDFTGMVALRLATVAVGWYLVARWRRGATAEDGALERRSVSFVLFAGALVLVAFLGIVYGAGVAAATGVALLAIVVGIALPARRLAAGYGLVAGLSTAGVVALVSLGSPFAYRDSPLERMVVAAIGVSALTAVVAATVSAGVSIITGGTARAWFAAAPHSRRVAAVGGGALIGALFWPHAVGSLYDLLWATQSARSLLPFALLWTVGLELRARSMISGRTIPLEEIGRLGVVALLAAVFEPTRTFWFLPVLAVLGASAFLALLTVGGRNRTVEQPYPPVKERLAGLERLVQVRQLDRVERRARVKRTEKVALGEMTVSASAAAERASAVQRTKLLSSDTTVEELDAKVSGYGPGDTAWAAGRIGAAYSAAVALPWVVLYWRESLAERSYSPFALDAAVDMLSIAVTWTAYGFLFGYFYPHIPGRRAVTKAALLALALIAPLVAYGAGYLVPLGVDSWSSVLALAVQIASHLLILAVLFDLHLVRRAGLPGDVLLDLRDLRPVAAWASALIVAVGGVVTSVVAAGLTTALSTGLGLLGPDAQHEPPPTASNLSATSSTSTTIAP